MKRLLPLIAFALIFSGAARAQTGTNCSNGTYQLSGSTQNTPPCGDPATTITYTATYNEQCVTTYGAQTPGQTYYTATSTVAATGTNYCPTFSSITCPPVMNFQETNGTSPTDYNRFYNRGYNYLNSGTTGCYQASMNQDFKQCLGQTCVASGGGGGGGGTKLACNPCNDNQDPSTCCSPIILDTTGHGYFLTDAAHGVMFDIGATGKPLQMAWTTANSGDAFLVLPGPDGLVHDGANLFGSGSPQPSSAHPNGFAALAVFDDPKNGGNGDGVIDSHDAIFSSLRLWIDANHDGISQPDELFTLPSLGVTSISLSYKMSERTDQYGNYLRYRALVNPGESANVGRSAYDVFFRLLNPSARCAVPKTTIKGGLLTVPAKR